MKENIMKEFILLSGMAILSAVGLSACGLSIVRGSGNVVSESRQVSGFDEVSLAGSGDVFVTQGDQEGLKIDAEDNVMPFLKTEVRGSTLVISLESNDGVIVRPTRPMRFYVSMKQVKSLSVSGSGTISSEAITSKVLDLYVTGSGETNIKNIKADSLTTTISGSGKCSLMGEAASQKLTITGSGSCSTDNLTSQNVKINVSGSGKAAVMAGTTLDVTITGSGEVLYSGSPKVSQRISGSGRIAAE
jgi:hypothetical protein